MTLTDRQFNVVAVATVLALLALGAWLDGDQLMLDEPDQIVADQIKESQQWEADRQQQQTPIDLVRSAYAQGVCDGAQGRAQLDAGCSTMPAAQADIALRTCSPSGVLQ